MPSKGGVTVPEKQDDLMMHRPEKERKENLLDRRPSEEYLQTWTQVIQKPLSIEQKRDTISVVVFRLAHEWLAMKTSVFKSVILRRQIHCIPHRAQKFLLGVVNVDGELQLCVALNELLGIEYSMSRSHHASHDDRMIAIAQNKELWVFPVDEVEGIHLWHVAMLENAPVNVSKSASNYLKGIMTIKNKSIGLLDEELIFYSLKRGVQ